MKTIFIDQFLNIELELDALNYHLNFMERQIKEIQASKRELLEKKGAVKNIEKTSKKIMSLDLKGWDPVKEIRKTRDERADVLLKRWEKD